MLNRIQHGISWFFFISYNNLRRPRGFQRIDVGGRKMDATKPWSERMLALTARKDDGKSGTSFPVFLFRHARREAKEGQKGHLSARGLHESM
jgi:hypothetical protein